MPFNFFIERTIDAKDLPLPKYMTEFSSGMDLHANIFDNIILKKGETYLVPTGIKIQIPKAFEAQIRPRSGLALKHKVTILNSPGTIDSDYQGEIKVILINFGDEDFVIKRSDRIAQMVINKVYRPSFLERLTCLKMPKTKRGESGFGHTGV